MTALERIRIAYDTLLRFDHHLLVTDSSERSLTHKLAEYMQREFPGWNIDCEYNRDGHEIKTLDGAVLPDIIVHHRGTSDNFVVIEAKKSTTSNAGNDIEKLHQFRKQLGYQIAIAVTFQVRNDARLSNSLKDVVEVT